MSGDGRQIRILLIGPSMEKPGGQAVQAGRLLTYFQGIEKLEVSFLPINPILPGPLRLLQRVKFLRTLVTEAAYLLSLLVRIPRTDVVHVFSASYFSFLLAPTPAILVGRLFSKRVVLNYRSGEADDHLARWGWHAKPLIRLANAVVTPSEYLVQVFQRHGLVAESVKNFVDLDRIPCRLRPAPAPRFLANRSLEPLYNVACVLRAFARIQREYPEATLTVAGDGSQRPSLEADANRLGLRQVRFLGSLDPDDMAQAYDDAEIYLNAPNIDNMPNSVVEAFAAGLPVVSTDAGGIPWILEHSVDGLLVPVGDDAALATAAMRLLREPGLATTLSTAGRRRAEQEFSWPAVRECWIDLYERICRADGVMPPPPSPRSGLQPRTSPGP